MELFLKQKLISIGDKYKFMDKSEKVVFEGKKSPLSLTKIFLNDPSGKELFMVKKKLIRILPKYWIMKDGQELVTIQGKFSIRPKFEVSDVEGNSYAITGDFLSFDFNISKNGKFVGSIKKKLFSFGDAYYLNIDDDFDPALFCAFALVIDNCQHNENNNRHR